MKRLVPFLLLLGACAPDITHNPRPAPAIVVAFDPGAMPVPVVPTPNDLAIVNGKIVIPVPPGEPPAQTEFNQVYLAGMTGFPFESTAQVAVSGALDPATVNAQNVIVLDLTTGTPVAGLSPVIDPLTGGIVVQPPAGGWTRAHQYMVALIAGPGRLRGANGEPVIGSPAWALVSSAASLVDCPLSGGLPDLTSPQCKPAVDVIPSAKTDPAARLRDQTHSAIQLEAIRQGYAPLLSRVVALENLPSSSSIPILWTFTIVDAGEVTFDPANNVIPFPNDIVLNGASGKVALPNPNTGLPPTAADCASTTDTAIQLLCGLNTLDGFSTIAAPISENGAATPAVAQANMDPASLSNVSVGLFPLSTKAPMAEQSVPTYTPAIGPTPPQQLQWQLDVPLVERTRYLAYVTSGVVDDKGKNVIANPVFALLRLRNPIAVGGKSQVSILSDAQASKLEPLRMALMPVFDELETVHVPRAQVTLAWTFTSQSEATILDQLEAYVDSSPLPAAMQGVTVLADATTPYKAAAAAGGIPIAAIGKFYSGVFQTPLAITGPGGTLDLASPSPRPVTFALAVPAAPPPATGYPIAIFGHAFTRDHNDFLAIANSLAAAGQATISADVVFHGERSSCTGYGAYATKASGVATTDDAACAAPATCNEDALVGQCVGGDFARDASGRPIISGWNIFSLSNFFATRDNLRQGVIDLAQLIHTLKVTGSASVASRIAAAGGSATFDLGTIGFVGQSLSGILGTLFNAVSPDTTNVVLNVPGGDLPQIILNAASFAPQKAALLAGLASQTPQILPNTPQYDQFIATLQWILDPADPTNMAQRLTHPVPIAAGATAPNANRHAFIQFIDSDQTIPNEFSTIPLLHAAAGGTFSASTVPGYGCMAPLYCYKFIDSLEGFDTTTVPLAGRHPFLLAPPSAPMQPPTAQSLALTAKAQTQVATFLATGMLP